MALTILLVEPDHALREEVRRELSGSGHRLFAFSSAAGACEALGETRPDLALLCAGDDPALDTLVGRLQSLSPKPQTVWIASSAGGEVEELVARRLPRGLLPRTGLSSQAARLAAQVERSRERGKALVAAPIMWGESETLRKVRHILATVSASGSATVLLTGESGTGKDVAARSLHAAGQRCSGPFVEVDCASIPASLMESELFGHEAGAFTDARQSRVGLLELAQGGTAFLDEIGEMEFGLQAKLLRVLDGRKLRRLGSGTEVPLDIHLIAATNRNLETEVREGRFRADLFYRLDVVRVELPPLRDRVGDVQLLAEKFLEETCRRLGRPSVRWSVAAMDAMTRYAWPGNIRELKNHVERLALLTPPGVSRIEDAGLPAGARVDRAAPVRIDLSRGPVSWESIERVALEEAMRAAQNNVSEAARLLELGRGALRYRLARHGLDTGEETLKQAA